MRFLMRALAGLVVLSLIGGLLAVGVGSLIRATSADDSDARRGPGTRERSFSARVEMIVPQSATPILTAYGETLSWRSLELRSAIPGRLVEVSDAFRDGGRVAAGEVLFRIDPADAQAALAVATANLAEAMAEAADARVALTLAEDDLQSSRRQLDLRQQALARQRDLSARGVATPAETEAAELAVAAAEQAVLSRRNALAQAEARIGRAEIAVQRAQISRDDAARTIADTSFAAPFAGLLANTRAVPGRLIGANEVLGELIDPAALEVAFTVSNTQFASLLADDGALMPLALTVSLELSGRSIEVPGRIDRSAARAGEVQPGRQIFARLDLSGDTVLRAGDFVTVRVALPPLDNVAVLPARALTPDGRVLLLGPDDRLQDVALTILHRQGDEVIVADAPFGREYVVERSAQLGAGVLLTPLRGPDGEDEGGDEHQGAPADERTGLNSRNESRRGG